MGNRSSGESSWASCCFKRDEDEEPPLDASSATVTMKAVPRGKLSRDLMFQGHERGKDLADSYDLDEEVLGRGGFGTVRRAVMKGNPSVVRAVKTVKKRNQRMINATLREIGALRRLDHPGICRLTETFEDQKCIYLVLEYIEGQELFDDVQAVIMRSKRYDERRAAGIMHQVFSALRYCHERSVIHRDLKPENIMVLKLPDGVTGDESTVPPIKIIDFGLAVLGENLGFSSNKIEGTADYLAPEVLTGTFSSASDVWSTGIIIFVTLFARFPLPNMVLPKAGISPSARSLLKLLLRRDPEQRISAKEAAEHPWTVGTDPPSALAVEDPHEMASAFLSFHQSTKLQKAALMAVATQLSGARLQKMRESFCSMDTDGNGVISREEMLQFLEKHPPEGIGDVKAWADSIFASLDSDDSGEIEFTEWQAAALRGLMDTSEEALHAAFRILDRDGSGTITVENLAEVMRQSPEEVGDWVRSFDINGDGGIDFDEFKKLLFKPADSGRTQELAVSTYASEDQ